jgi:hypothetical protein
VPLTTSLQNSNKNTTKPLQLQTSQEVTKFGIEQKRTLSIQNHNTSLHKKCAIGVHFESADSDLKMVVERWPRLSKNIKITIKTLVETASNKPSRATTKKEGKTK